MTLDTRKWFDRSQPQTLQIATWLLYLNGVFALIGLIDSSGESGRRARVSRAVSAPRRPGCLVVAYAAGGFLMANERKLGYYPAILAALSPFLLRFWVFSGVGACGRQLTGGQGT